MSENNKPAISEQEKKRRNIFAVLVIVFSVATIVLVLLKLFDVIGVDAYMPVMAVVLALQAGMFWNERRWLAIFNLCVSAFAVLVFCITTYIHCVY